MNSISTKLFTSFLISLLILTGTVKAQCNPPDLSFINPTLVAGTDRSEGAVYKFANVTPGVDCYITLVKLNGGAQLINMETPGMGYPDAWQPIINGPGTPLGNKSWIDWTVSFRSSATGLNYPFVCLAICAIDVDGDSGNIGEFIESDGQSGYAVPFPSVLTVTDKGSGKLEAQGPVYNRIGIDTFSLDVRINYFFNGLDSISLKIGQTVLGPGTGGATQRLNSIYFKKVTLTPFFILAVKSAGLKGMIKNKGVELKWQTDEEVNYTHFEVERSFSGDYFTKIADVKDAIAINSSNSNYRVSDNNGMLGFAESVYYRIKQIDVNNKFTYSNIIKVKLSALKGIVVQVSPNPFRESVTVNMTSADNGRVVIKIRSLSGQTMFTKEITVKKGKNSLQIGNLEGLSKGTYITQTLINDLLVDTQKIIKE